MLGKNIRTARQANGWSQQALADKIDSTTSYVTRIETGKINPSVFVVEKIADLLGCSLDRLVKGKLDAQVYVKDKKAIERLRLLETLDADERAAVYKVIDIVLMKKKIQDLTRGAA